MTLSLSGVAHSIALSELLERRAAAAARFFGAEAGRLARLCHQMAERFARDGRLLAMGLDPAARSDVRHVTVEFVHPVIVGKRALPAIGICADAEELAGRIRLLTLPEDIVISFGPAAPALREATAFSRRSGCLTISFTELGAEWEFPVPSEDPFVAQELAETAYHVLWELVHVFFEHRGLLSGRTERRTHDSGASAFLYPFLAEQEHDLESVIADVTRSVLMKSDEVTALRRQTFTDGHDELIAAARELRGRLDGGGKVLALGNGGSATDAQDLVADLRSPPVDAWTSWPALDLSEDPAILTAIANDIGPEAIFSRQVIAYGRPADALVTFSTSGNSVNVIDALGEARRRGMLTIAFVGYDGGQVAAQSLADRVIVTSSQHIPRIQEAQASAYHALRELIENHG